MLTARKQSLTLKRGAVGLISDTHGLLRPEALAALKGSELIIHAGDIGKPAVLESLTSIAPVIAIRGNNDRGPWVKKLPDVFNAKINGVLVHVIHNVKEMADDPRVDGFKLVVSGHSHKPSVIEENEVLFINPGSAGPRRFKLPVTVAWLFISGPRQTFRCEIIELNLQ